MNNIEYIRTALPETEVLAQLAEECAELAQAALKLRRALKPDSSPTPCSVSEAIMRFHEEIADVLVCLKVSRRVDNVTPLPPIEGIMRGKTERWAQRLGKREAT